VEDIEDGTSMDRDDKATVKSRHSGFTFKEHHLNYKTSGSYVPRKAKEHRRLLAKQKTMSEMSVQKRGFDEDLESEDDWTKPIPPVKSQPELTRVEDPTLVFFLA
jgi:hypothetical protein